MSISLDTATLNCTIKCGNKNEILKMVQEKIVDLEGTNENGDTALHLIFQNGNLLEKEVIELLETLLERVVDPNVENKNEETVLHLAVANRMRDVVEFLIRCNADIDKSDKEGNSIAHFFVLDENKKFCKFLGLNSGRLGIPTSKFQEMESKSASFIEWLIEKGFDFDRRNKKGKSALHLSIEYNLLHILPVLLKHAQNIDFVDEHNKTLLHSFFETSGKYKKKCREHAVILKLFSGHWYWGYDSRHAARIVKTLLDRGVSAVALDDYDRTPLWMAVKDDEEVSVIEMLVNNRLGTCPQNDDLATTVLLELLKSCAWWRDSKLEYFLNFLHALIAKGSNVNGKDKEGITPIYCAFGARNRHAADLLDDYCADFSVITVDGENLFHALARNDSPYGLYDKSTNQKLEALFELLVSKGCCDLNARGKGDKTPLHLACRDENLVIVQKLIKYGANVNCKNVNGQTPLYLAVHHNKAEEVVELLVERGADVNGKDLVFGCRLLDYAVSITNYALVSVLLKGGAYVNVYDDGYSPFSKAIRFGFLSIAEEMLMYGADINDERIIKLLGESENQYDCPMKVQFLMEHWIKLDAAKLPRLKKNEDFANYNKYQKFYIDCCTEIRKLQCTYIDSCTSIYAFLHMDLGTRRSYINNKVIKNLVNCPNLKEQFPQYFVLILASYRETVMWKSLLEPAKRAWLELTDIALPDVCIELIFAYLRNQDLVSMIEHDDDV